MDEGLCHLSSFYPLTLLLYLGLPLSDRMNVVERDVGTDWRPRPCGCRSNSQPTRMDNDSDVRALRVLW